MTTTKKEAIIAKVRALMAKTTDNGCTEAEAMAAMEKIADLMHQYSITESDVNTIKEAAYGKRARPYASGTHNRRVWHPTRNCFGQIAALCNCKYWTQGADMVFFGERTDTETAHYLQTLMQATSERELHAYRQRADRPKVNGTVERTSFLYGFAERVNERIEEIIQARKAASAGTELMVLRVRRSDLAPQGAPGEQLAIA